MDDKAISKNKNDPSLMVWNAKPELRKSHVALSQITFEQNIAIVSLLKEMPTNSDLQEAKSRTAKNTQELISARLVVEQKCWANEVAYGWVSKTICLQQNMIFNYSICYQTLCIKLHDMCLCVVCLTQTRQNIQLSTFTGQDPIPFYEIDFCKR